jgi:hypothetical protein
MANTYTINNLAQPTSNVTVANGGSSWASTTGSTITLNTGAGANGTYLTSTGIGGAGSVPIYTTGTGTSNTYTWQNPADQVMTIKQTNPPELEVKGRMVINGIDLEERLKTIEKVLQIPERDVKLEKKHPKLKKLYDDYINALGKYRTFEAIKGEEDGTT